MKIFSSILILLMVTIALSADYLLKIAGTKDSMLNRYFFGGMILYSLTAFVWYYILRTTKFSGANLLYSLFTVLLSVAIGVFFFKESLHSIEIIGVIMAITSIIILTRFS